MSQPQYQVQEDLPDGYLLALGIYVQTCSRIELWAARLICLTNKMSRLDPDFTPVVDKLRTGQTWKLVSDLKASFATLQEQGETDTELLALGNYIEKSLETRNKAVHGTHIVLHNGFIMIDAGEKLDRTRAAYDPTILQATVDNADQVLRKLKAYCEAI